jgi:proteasome assembly chaperone (PAC2) family protein
VDYISTYASPELRNPVLIAAFAGWNDASEAATFAARVLIQQWQARKLAEIDPEEFFVFTDSRPHVRMVGRFQRRVDWPANEFYYHSDPDADRDYVVLVGTEPQLKWRTFTQAVLAFCRQQGIKTVVTLGGLVADVPHTLPVRLSGLGSPAWLGRKMRQAGIAPTRYEGPTGIVGVLNSTAVRRRLATASLWATSPEYLSASPNPKVALALLEALQTLLDLRVDLTDLRSLEAQFDRQVAEIVAEDTELQDYVRQLEEQVQAEEAGRLEAEERRLRQEPLPSGEELVREVEEFLRRRRPRQGGSPS